MYNQPTAVRDTPWLAGYKYNGIECYLASHPRISSKSLAKAFGFGNSLKNNQYENLRGNLMVVASLIAQMSFQVATNPPGGFWQVDTKSSDEGCPEDSGIYKDGTSVLAYTRATYIFSMLMIHVQTDNGIFSHSFLVAPTLLAVLIISLVHHHMIHFGICLIYKKINGIPKRCGFLDSTVKRINNLKSKVCRQVQRPTGAVVGDC
ncbi:hypothetical protein Pint_29038 [Pistacia integerrima]|uniref:Uncharacterized protein n=1 Tax=Pistacia integerrima TaxID=434235 RepID=A0ACC0X2B0_9ROSI|nr:hypothetical protein Pint_29038 [Pistacia integerrima]